MRAHSQLLSANEPVNTKHSYHFLGKFLVKKVLICILTSHSLYFAFPFYANKVVNIVKEEIRCTVLLTHHVCNKKYLYHRYMYLPINEFVQTLGEMKRT